jgi:hypothetical protein
MGDVEEAWEKSELHTKQGGISHGKRLLRRRWEDNIQRDLTKI